MEWQRSATGSVRLNTVMLGVAGVVLMVIVGLSYREWRHYTRANAEAGQSRQIVDSIDQLLFSLLDAETSQRGFLLTGENRYLQPYDEAIGRIPTELAAVRNQLSGRSTQATALARLNTLVDQKLTELRQTIELRRSQGSTPAMAIVLSDRGKRAMDEIRDICAQIRRNELSSQAQASTEGEAGAQTALLATVSGSLVLLMFFGIGFDPFMSAGSKVKERHWLVRYGAAAVATGVAILLRLALTPLIGGSHSAIPFITFFPAILLAAWYGGFRTGAFSILLSTVAAYYFFLEPERSWRVSHPGDLVTLFIFVLVSFGIVFMSESQRRAIQRADQAENAEREQRQWFETTLASIGDAVIVTDDKGRVTFSNKVAQTLIKWPAAQIAGRELAEVFKIVNEFTRATVESPVARVLREGSIVGLANHAVLIARDETEVPIDDSAAPIRGANGAILGTVLVFRDITARRRAEEAVRESEKRYHLAVEAAPNGMAVIDERGEIVLVNACTEKLFRYTREEMVGQRIEMLVPDRFRMSHPTHRQLFLGESRARAMGAGRDLYGLRKDGSEFPVEIGLSPIETNAGTWVLSAIVDITERRQAEEQRVELLAKDRALASEKALRETEAELARVVRGLSVGELATSIAHEINQPLAGVVTNAQAGLRWLSSDPPNIEEARESLSLIARDGNRASAVVKRIREFLGKKRHEGASLNIGEVVQEAATLGSPDFPLKVAALR